MSRVIQWEIERVWDWERVREWESERVRVREWESERVREWESERVRMRVSNIGKRKKTFFFLFSSPHPHLCEQGEHVRMCGLFFETELQRTFVRLFHDWLIGRHKQTHSCHVKLGYTAYTAVGRHEISGYKCRQSRSWKTVKLHFVVRRSRVIKYLFYTLFISNRFEFSIIVLFGFEQRLRHSMSTTFSENWKN